MIRAGDRSLSRRRPLEDLSHGADVTNTKAMCGVTRSDDNDHGSADVGVNRFG